MTILNNLSFCSSDPCSSPEEGRLPHHEGKKPSFLACSILWRRRKKTTKKKHERRRHHQEPIMADSSISTDLALEEWFAKSPSVENKRICNNNDDDGDSKLINSVSFSGQFSLEELLNTREFQTSSLMETDDDDSRDLMSLSLEKLLMMREKDERKKKVESVEVGLYSLTKSKSLSRERKVSFRLPEASDIIILNSPERA